MDGTRAGYDRVATDYARAIAGELAAKPLDRALLAATVELAPPGAFADLGCGPGHVAAHLRRSGRDVVGVDLSPGMCRLAAAVAVPCAAGDLAALPLRDGCLAGVVSLYAVIHLDAEQRSRAYREIARVLCPGGVGVVAFHTPDSGTGPGGARRLTEWWGHDIDVVFRFLDPADETDRMARTGLALVARTDRRPDPAVEHPSRRSYLIVRRED